MKNKKIGLLVLGILTWAVFCIPGYEEVVSYVWNSAGKPVVVVDAGHGGIDGGTESSDGTVEKEINLKLARLLKEHLEEKGIRVIMTRKDENGLYDESPGQSIRSLKTQDMHARKKIIDDVGPALAVSIHLNSFTQDPSVKGAQVFYPSYGEEALVEKSKAAAAIIQQGLNRQVNIEKERMEMGKDDVFLLKNITCPIVIAECGFLSNQEEAVHLKKESYQEKIAASLGNSIYQYLWQNGYNNQNNPVER